MKALTIHQPYAWAIMTGLKRVENRSRRFRHQGRLLIHAASRRGYEDVLILPDGTPVPPVDQLVFGALLGSVNVVDCVPAGDLPNDPFASGPWCLLLDDPELLPIPIPYRGQQAFFHVPDEFLREPVAYLQFQDN
jgi:hypothetical protein